MNEGTSTMKPEATGSTRKRRTAPRRTASKNLPEKKIKTSQRDNDLVNRLIRKQKLYIMNSIAHNLLPDFNKNIHKTSLKKITKMPTFQCSAPSAVYISELRPHQIDLCHRRTLAHQEYLTNIKKEHNYYQEMKKQKDFKKLTKNGIYPTIIYKYATLLESNPDPYFHAKFDWYYTGGNLCSLHNNNLLCHASGKSLETLYLSRLRKNDKIKKLISMDFVLKNDSPLSEIFEIQSSATSNQFYVRQKNFFSILSQKNDNNLCCDYVLENLESPFITATGVLKKPQMLITGDLNKSIKLWDLEWSIKKSRQILFTDHMKTNDKSRNWNCIRTLDTNTYIMADLNRFYILDSRQPPSRPSQFAEFNSYYEICEKISSMTISNFDHTIYFGTSHKLFTIDTRFMPTPDSDLHENKAIIQRWTHQMDAPPTMLKTYFIDNQQHEMIAMSSMVNGDIRICENFREHKTKHKMSLSLPFSPISLFDNYQDVQQNGKCLDLFTNLENRIKCCTTGLDFYHKNETLNLLYANSIGDIFKHELNFDIDDNSYTNESNEKLFEMYDKKVKKQLMKNPIPLNLSHLVNMKGIMKILQCKEFNNLEDIGIKSQNLTSNPTPVETRLPPTNSEEKRPDKKPKWQKSIEELQEYKDVLVSNILSVWNMDINEQNVILPLIPKETAILENQNRISDWLLDTSIGNNSEINLENSLNDQFVPPIQSTLMNAIFDETMKTEDFNNSVIPTQLTIPLSNSLSFGNDIELENNQTQMKMFENTRNFHMKPPDHDEYFNDVPDELPSPENMQSQSTIRPSKNVQRVRFVKGF